MTVPEKTGVGALSGKYRPLEYLRRKAHDADLKAAMKSAAPDSLSEPDARGTRIRLPEKEQIKPPPQSPEVREAMGLCANCGEERPACRCDGGYKYAFEVRAALKSFSGSKASKQAEPVKPCPVCEATDCNRNTVFRREEMGMMVQCIHCGTSGPFSVGWEKGVAAWNALPRRDELRGILLPLIESIRGEVDYLSAVLCAQTDTPAPRAADPLKLKRCPFCGGQAGHSKDMFSRHHVSCFPKCGAFVEALSEREAREAWNRRAEEDKNGS